ncbi:FAD:protein FMN transferase [Pelomonas sp. BJYL3]|uniref:FAD:protein FMN transferase n=1 Tax=Pelomonas sp. BJYL3 TaxID=2976697 RepID=UPI0022B478FB|nr:FAD:protein FMN transferase [Pelomonas sp. BJYL3]
MCSADFTTAGLQRRAQPVLGTLVELGLRHPDPARGAQALEEGFALLARLEGQLSRFQPASDVARFNALPGGAHLALRPATQRVMAAADWLRQRSAGRFDPTLGSGPQGWQLRGGVLHKTQAGVQLDLGGIAKGFVVDRLVALMRRSGAVWGSVNAGGDLRVFGPDPVPLLLRDEERGGLREFGQLADGAFASSHYAPGSRSQLHGLEPDDAVQVAVAAPSALWADALCKLAGLGALAVSGAERESALLTRLQARVWIWRR